MAYKIVSCCLCGFAKTKGRVETFHTFPKHLLQQQKWIDFMNMPNWQPLPNSKLCSKHFSPDCFDRSGKITKLIIMAVPTIKFERFEQVCNNEPDDIPRKNHLKRKIMRMATNEKLLRKQITKLQKVIYRQKRRIENLTSVVSKLQRNGMITYNAKEVLVNCFGSNRNLFLNIFKRASYKNKKCKKKDDIRKFAITSLFFTKSI
ncbi:THAP domain-containing protein 2-like [Odontomachus brunneus]|uniref:THAP domain-containing protein 2-like n=1 Tax=Odontomachus brunneus TaxID=486640 RepID=UPI0013F2720F|nr:THAP domain-containing protein 2-like [Odontomachus brunneus]